MAILDCNLFKNSFVASILTLHVLQGFHRETIQTTYPMALQDYHNLLQNSDGASGDERFPRQAVFCPLPKGSQIQYVRWLR